MTIEEARNWLIQYPGLAINCRVHELALNALEKQIPKEPLIRYDNMGF